MTQDLTKIKTPFGLLDAETQEALRAHGGPYEWWRAGNWEEPIGGPIGGVFSLDLVYRVKPQPPEPREWWIVGGCEAWDNEADAREYAKFLAGDNSVIRVREVLK